jgi:hypothetical protein
MYESYIKIVSQQAYPIFLEMCDNGSGWNMVLEKDDNELTLSKKFNDLEDAKYVTRTWLNKLGSRGEVVTKIVKIIQDWM